MKYNIAHKFVLEIDEETVRESKANVNNLEELREMIKKIRPARVEEGSDISKIRTVLKKISKGDIGVNKLIIQQEVYVSRLSYIIRTADIDIVFSTIPNSIFPNYMLMIDNGVETKVHDIDIEKELFLECWEDKSMDMDVEVVQIY